MASNRVLVDALASLTNPDGTVQEGERKLALGALVLQLNESEVISLRIRLNLIPTPDPVARLPFEIPCRMLKYLDLEDSIALRLVCRDWNRRFSSLDFCKAMVKWHFPAKYTAYTEESKQLAIEFEAMNVSGVTNDLSGKQEEDATTKIQKTTTKDDTAGKLDLRQQDAELRLNSWLERAVRYRIRRMRGQSEYTSISRLTHDLFGNSECGSQYCNGRVGQFKDLQTIQVWSLRNNTNEQFTSPQREMIDPYWELSDCFVVALSRSRSTVYAWPLESPGSPFRDNPHSQRLPNAIRKFFVSGDRVAFYLSNEEVYIWTIGSSLVAIPPDKTRGLVYAVVFHPSKQDTFFICTGSHVIDRDGDESPDTFRGRTTASLEMRRTRFHFYEYEGTNIKSRFTAYLNSTRWNAYPKTAIHTLHDNVIGISNLCGFRKLLPTQSRDAYDDLPSSDTNYSEDTIDEFGVEDENEEGSDLFRSERSFLEFDMDTKQFQCHNYYDPSREGDRMYQKSIRTFIWRNQTIIVADGLPNGLHRPKNATQYAVSWPELADGTSETPNVLLTAVNHLPGRISKEIYWYREDASHLTIKHRSPPSEHDRKHMVAFHYAGGPEIVEYIKASKRGGRYPCSEVKKVRGDDDFMVLCLDDYVVVWSFGPVIRPLVPLSDLPPMVYRSPPRLVRPSS
ncbi:hypothetical protein VTL71DRAFT_2281 [Oculimacula yallundae]|uniref:F-box domain-containing protein n=1 Tax=Oculimacula yallundae TaxID=86028 RepID=A0ABR4C8H0_9HELO